MKPVSLAVLAITCLAAEATGASREAVRQVDRGIERFDAGDYEGAATAFAEADVAQPEDPWIAFDRACAHAARGENDEAIELYRQSALARDRSLVVRSRYNLGSLAAGQATTLFGATPENAAPDVRTEGLDLLARAVGHYRGCLELDPKHEDARHNLEVIRLWIKQMRSVWQERDRQKQRDEMDLLAFLEIIRGRQRELRTTTKVLTGESDSPRRRQEVAMTASAQRELAEEIEPLKEKIAAAHEPKAAGAGNAPTGANSPPTPDAEKALELLTRWADDAYAAMDRSALELSERSLAEASRSQSEALTKLNEIQMGVAPFPNLVQQALGAQRLLVGHSESVVASESDEEPETDFDELVWDQRRVARWSEVLPLKAQQMRETLAAQEATAEKNAGADPKGPNQEAGDAAKDAKEKIESFRASIEKAIELAPKAHELADEATGFLEQRQAKEALPIQKDVLKLLEEIAEPLPKEPQNQQKEQQQKEKNDKQKQDEPKKQEGKQDPKKKDEPKQDRNQPKKAADEKGKDRKPQSLDREQAKSLLRKVRERERKRRDLKKRLQRRLYRPGTVDKDW